MEKENRNTERANNAQEHERVSQAAPTELLESLRLRAKKSLLPTVTFMDKEFEREGCRTALHKKLFHFLKDMERAHREVLSRFADCCWFDLEEDTKDRHEFEKALLEAEATVVKEHDLSVLNFVEHLETDYRKQLDLKPKKETHLKGWIFNDKRIEKILDKTRFEDVFNYLAHRTMHPKKAREIRKEIGVDMYNKKKEYDHVIVRPDYRAMGRKLGMSERNCRAYVQEFDRIGVLQKLGRRGSTGRTVYSIGYRTPAKRIWFLKKSSRMVRNLRTFKVRHQNKR